MANDGFSPPPATSAKGNNTHAFAACFHAEQFVFMQQSRQYTHTYARMHITALFASSKSLSLSLFLSYLANTKCYVVREHMREILGQYFAGVTSTSNTDINKHICMYLLQKRISKMGIAIKQQNDRQQRHSDSRQYR